MNENSGNTLKSDVAEQLFLSGYNCSQSVLCAFAKEIGLTQETATKLASGFGGGIGRMREVCGAVSGMTMVLSMLKGYSDPAANEKKTQTYELIQNAAKMFEKETGSIICRELLNLQKEQEEKETPQASERTKEYYKYRPCAGYCRLAAQITQSLL